LNFGLSTGFSIQL